MTRRARGARERGAEDAERLLARHERLCLARAFPRSRAELRRVERELAGFERRVARVRDALANTGIAGTLYRYPFNYAMTRWLSERYGKAVDVDWEEYDRHEWDEVTALLSLVVAWAENEGLDDDAVKVWDWIRAARGRYRGTDLEWLIATLRSQGFRPELEQHLFECLNLPIRWDLAGCGDAVTHARLPVRRVFYHRGILSGGADDFLAEVGRPVGQLEALGPRLAGRVIAAARAALSLREREFHVIVHANRREIYRVRCGRGLEIYIIGLAPLLRLTLESDYGALLVKNGVPIGYGYAVLLFDRADIAVNVFPTYRGAESAYVFGRFVAAFHHHFGATKFVMRRYQLGHQNPEGIESGSFWFYYKLNFRSLEPVVRAAAERERRRLARRRGARSSPAVLRRLARSDMVLDLAGGSAGGFADVDVKEVGLAVTRLLAGRYRGDRAAGARDCARRVAAALGARWVRGRLVPVLALVPHLARWPLAARRKLLGLLRAKEGTRERPFVLAMQRHPRWRAWLLRHFAARASPARGSTPAPGRRGFPPR